MIHSYLPHLRSHHMRAILLATGLLIAGRSTAGAKDGILVLAHGGHTEWNEIVYQAVAPLEKAFAVEYGLVIEDQQAMAKAVKSLEAKGADRIAVVRMFMSGESFLPESEYLFGVTDQAPSEGPTIPDGADGAEEQRPGRRWEPIQSKADIRVSRQGVADSPLVGEILADRVKALSESPQRERVLVLGHGPAESEAANERWLSKMHLAVQEIWAIGPFVHVACETTWEDRPDRHEEALMRIRRYIEEGAKNGERVIVVPFRIAGFGRYAEMLEGLEYVSDGLGLCPHPNMTRWILQTAEDCFAAREQAALR